MPAADSSDYLAPEAWARKASTASSGRSISVWTGDQLRRFLDAMADHELYPLYLLAATTGMRRRPGRHK